MTPLSPTELRILHMVAEGLTDARIGARTGVTRDGVTKSLGRLYRKLGARNRAHAVHIAHQHGLLQGQPW